MINEEIKQELLSEFNLMYPNIRQDVVKLNCRYSKEEEAAKGLILNNANILNEIRTDMFNVFCAISNNEDVRLVILSKTTGKSNIKYFMDWVFIFLFRCIAWSMAAKDSGDNYRLLMSPKFDKYRKNRLWTNLENVMQQLLSLMFGETRSTYLDKFETMQFDENMLNAARIKTHKRSLNFLVMGQKGIVRSTKAEVINCFGFTLNVNAAVKKEMDCYEFEKLVLEYEPKKNRDFFVEAPTNSKYTQKIAKTVFNAAFGLYTFMIKYAKIGAKDLDKETYQMGITVTYDNLCRVGDSSTSFSMADVAYQPIAVRDRFGGMRNFMSSMNIARNIVCVTT